MREIIASYSDEKRKNERFDFWLYHIGRRLSWPIAWAAINLGITATGVTFISAFFVWTGAVLIMVGSPLWQLIGASFFQLWIIFDCADGTVARATKTGSKRGEYADAFGGYSVSMLLYSSMGVAAARQVLGLERVVPLIRGTITGNIVGAAIDRAPAISASEVLVAGAFLMAGVGASLLSLYARLLYQKFLNVFEDQARQARPIKPRDDRNNPIMIAAQNLAANSGFALPLAFVALLVDLAPWYVLFYVIVNGGMLVLTVRRTLTRKATAALDVAGPGAAAAMGGSGKTTDVERPAR